MLQLFDSSRHLTLLTLIGLKVYSCYVEQPIVKGDIAFATEVHDDDGLPHCLEHLVFLGCKRFPYKGLLDILANKSFASGTNAMTEVDATSYNIRTAGSEGFLNFLPIYLEHLFFPTLTDEGFLTEVHHINGQGEDAGVAYSEMLACQNKGSNICSLKMNRILYPSSGYNSETGGLVENIRESLNNVKVRNYHQNYYIPKNCSIIVTGPVTAEEIFQALRPFEKELLESGLADRQIERPWQTPIKPLEKSVVETIPFPSDTDDDCLVYIGLRGPQVDGNNEQLVALEILIDYLLGTSASPLQREFVECLDPICSSLGYTMQEYRETSLIFEFESVDRENLSKFPHKFFQVLKQVETDSDSFDMNRVSTIIHRKEQQLLVVSEKNPHNLILVAAKSHFLYGNGSLSHFFDTKPILNNLKIKPVSYWIGLLNRYLSGDNVKSVCIIGEASRKHMELTAKEEKDRLEKQKRALENELTEYGAKLDRATKFNDRPIPSDLLQLFHVPSIETIKYPRIEREIVEDGTPIKIFYDSVDTNFVTMYICMDTSQDLTTQDRLYLPLISELILESPLNRNGIIIPYEEVVEQLEQDFIDTAAMVGLGCAALSNLFLIIFKVEVKNYAKAINWLKDILFNTQFTHDRIKTVATKMVGDIAQEIRSGSSVCDTAISSLLHDRNCNSFADNMFRQYIFLKKLLKQLEIESSVVQDQVTKVRNLMCLPKNIFTHMTVNKSHFEQDKSLIEPWNKLLPDHIDVGKKFTFDNMIPDAQSLRREPGPIGILIGVGSVDSNFLNQAVPIFTDPYHPDLPALHVLKKYLFQLEGPMWRGIRGRGLSYSYGLNINVLGGYLMFYLYRATQIIEAYAESKKIIYSYLDGESQFEHSLIVSAKSSLVYDFMKTEENSSCRSLRSLIGHCTKVSIDYNKEMIQKIQDIDVKTMKDVGNRYLRVLFESDQKRVSVCCNPSKAQDVIAGLDKLGCKIEQTTMDNPDLLNFE